MQDFLKECLSRAGADTMITPREIIRDYMSVLNILLQNPETSFASVVGSGAVTLSHSDQETVAETAEEKNIGDFDLADIDI
ncbi:MAG: DUF2791 family P-loop domain-containing protein, partial [Firmicutes bacterium]|nr:DUF2791 family P-loop domain-containing protein [Bacillota bacterium]